MKATGIVRRIDDLGRVVIPKEIRRALGIQDGDPMEVFTNNVGEITLRRYDCTDKLRKAIGDVSRQVEMGEPRNKPQLLHKLDELSRLIESGGEEVRR